VVARKAIKSIDDSINILNFMTILPSCNGFEIP
jgi:hypothetical protein